MPYISGVHQDLISDLGPAAIARILSIKTPSVVGWKGRVPRERRADLERALYPRVTVEQFGSDVRWVRVPDPTWPHPEGRPCIDVATPRPALVAPVALETSRDGRPPFADVVRDVA